MLKIALTGGLASGKSFAGEILQRLGCLLIKADALGHEVLLPGGEAYADVLSEFGNNILNDEGFIERKKLAALVFFHPGRLEALNRLVHPPVRARTERMLADFAATDPKGIAVVEAAIHIETGGYRAYDRLILAWCLPEQQIERAMHRDASSREEVMVRLSRQMPLEEKRKFAHYVVDTSGRKEDTQRQTEEIYQELRRIAQ
ncbi:MAG: dephospho-CoA kinase [Candidatus Solibacter usitatus]|nr:dephospho-CoA kinase [Candidatus Solibacter usitatus]